MKRRLFLYLSLFFILASFTLVNDSGDRFLKDDWSDAVKEAKRTGKPMFVYLTAENCGACRRMEKTTMKNEQVLEFYNKNFVCVKLSLDDMSNTMRAGRWNIQAVPAVVFLDTKRNMVLKGAGFQSSEELVVKGQSALDKIVKKKQKQKRQSNNIVLD